MSNYAINKEFDYVTDVDTSDLAAKKHLITLKAEVDKLNIGKLVNIPSSLNNLKTKGDDLDIGELKIVPVDLKLSDVLDNEVIKNTNFNTLKTKVNNLHKKIPDAITFIYINQHNTDKQNLQKKLEMLLKKYQIRVV